MPCNLQSILKACTHSKEESSTKNVNTCEEIETLPVFHKDVVQQSASHLDSYNYNLFIAAMD